MNLILDQIINAIKKEYPDISVNLHPSKDSAMIFFQNTGIYISVKKYSNSVQVNWGLRGVLFNENESSFVPFIIVDRIRKNVQDYQKELEERKKRVIEKVCDTCGKEL